MSWKALVSLVPCKPPHTTPKWGEGNQGVGNDIMKMLPAVKKKGMRQTKIIMILL
jgi:hypothetical protein